MKTTLKKRVFFVLYALFINTASIAQQVSDFENLSLAPNSYWDGSSSLSGATFTSGDAVFKNYYNPAYGGYWDGGFAYTNIQDSTTGDYTNIYASKALTGYNGSSNYVVGKDGAIVHLTGTAQGKRPKAMYISNSTYAYTSMKNGDGFAKKFGGNSGNEEDFFKLTIKKWLSGSIGTDSIVFYLADFRFSDNSKDYIIKDWTLVDLSAIGEADSLIFNLSSSDVGAYGMNTPGYFCMDNFNSTLVFASAVQQVGTTAIDKDSSAFKAWATSCTVTRGYQDISNTSLGYVTVGDNTMGVDKAGENGVVSLGDGGSAILTFAKPILNEEGYDFAVFENSFSDTFLELAFVEVSSDGVNYVRFPAISYVQDTLQIDNAGSIDAREIHNLAGKYRGGYGTPFDLEELKDSTGIDINNITHVKIIDVVGSIQNTYATRDSKGNKINDPWPTAFASGGFDLDAVGVIHSQGEIISPPLSVSEYVSESFFSNVYPNPVNGNGAIQFNLQVDARIKATATDMQGQTIVLADDHMNQGLNTISLSTFSLSNGAYFLQLIAQDNVYSQKMIVKND